MVGETDQALQRIAQGIVSIDGLVDGIAKSFSGQSAGLAEVNIAIEQMDQVTQQNAAMVEEATAATHSLTGETDELVRLVSSFTLAGSRPKPVAAPIRTVQPRLVRAAGGGGSRTSDWEEF
jgi:methyl-accepting chemotaxis protein